MMLFGRKRETQGPVVGQDVMTNDEESLGTVVAVHDDHLEVEGGSVDRHIIWHVPRAAVRKVDEQTVYLSASLAAVRGWDHHAAH